MSDEAPEALRRLEEQLSHASQTAERLIAEAARAARGDRPPPAGWQSADGDEGQGQRPSEFEALLAGLAAVRDLIPAEVLTRLAAALREVLLAVRALIDLYVARLEPPRSARDEVRDIPID